MPGLIVPPLLHNMSVAPRTVITHRPTADPLTTGNVFELPRTVRRVSATSLLALLGPTRFRHTRSGAEAELRRRVNEHARALPFPPVAVVSDQSCGEDQRCTDLLTIVTVLSKTGEKAYLRDKEPNFSCLATRKRIVLRLPTAVGENR